MAGPAPRRNRVRVSLGKGSELMMRQGDGAYEGAGVGNSGFGIDGLAEGEEGFVFGAHY